MDGYLHLSGPERKTCLATIRAARSARRALILVLLADSWSYRQIGAATFASPKLVQTVKRDFAAGGVERVLVGTIPTETVAVWLVVVVR